MSTLPNSLIGSKFSFDFLRLSNSPGITESAPYRIAFLNFMVVCLRCLDFSCDNDKVSFQQCTSNPVIFRSLGISLDLEINERRCVIAF